MHNPDASYDPRIFSQAVAAANRQGRPLFIIVLATKPCYIKLASLVHALDRKQLPFLVADTGQHYDLVLTGAKDELAYQHLIGVHLRIRGDLLGRTADLAVKLRWLAGELSAAGLREAPIPVVSGDTSTAALLPAFWYLLTGYRSVHVEAGLRSLGPTVDWRWQDLAHLSGQRQVPWVRFRDEPFPEGVDTRLASVTSDLLLAPVQRNVDNLLREGYDAEQIRLVGSLSADAVRLALDGAEHEPARASLAQLSAGKWLRVDIHRRENTVPAKLTAILGGLADFSACGGQVVLIMTNALRTALAQHGLHGPLHEAQRQGVLVQDLWPSYLDVIYFLRSPNCRAIFTDSGGLQEEAHILGVPCITCRYSTDRPETVLDQVSNILLPPADRQLVARGLEAVLSSAAQQEWQGLRTRSLYGERVGERIAELLSEYVPPPPVNGAEVVFQAPFSEPRRAGAMCGPQSE